MTQQREQIGYKFIRMVCSRTIPSKNSFLKHFEIAFGIFLSDIGLDEKVKIKNNSHISTIWFHISWATSVPFCLNPPYWDSPRDPQIWKSEFFFFFWKWNFTWIHLKLYMHQGCILCFLTPKITKKKNTQKSH